MSGPWASWAKDEDFAKDLKVEVGDVLLAKVWEDGGRPQDEILLRRAGPPHAPTCQQLGFGDVGVFEFLASSDDYYAWWMEHGAEDWTSSQLMIGKYHLCNEETVTCQGKAKWAREHPDGIVHIGDFRLICPGDLEGMKWVRGPKRRRIAAVLGENWDKPPKPPRGEGPVKGTRREGWRDDGTLVCLEEGDGVGGREAGPGRGTFVDAVDDLRREFGKTPGADRYGRRDRRGEGRNGVEAEHGWENRRSSPRRQSHPCRCCCRCRSRSEDEGDQWRKEPFCAWQSFRRESAESLVFRDASPIVQVPSQSVPGGVLQRTPRPANTLPSFRGVRAGADGGRGGDRKIRAVPCGSFDVLPLAIAPAYRGGRASGQGLTRSPERFQHGQKTGYMEGRQGQGQGQRKREDQEGREDKGATADEPLPSSLASRREGVKGNTGQTMSALQLRTWSRQALVTLPTDRGRSAQEVSRSRRWLNSATSGLFPLSPSMLEAEGCVRARPCGLDPQAVGDGTCTLGVLPTYLAVGMKPRPRKK